MKNVVSLTCHEDFITLAEEFKNALLDVYKEKGSRFIDTERNSEGLVFMCNGLLSLLLLSIAFGQKFGENGAQEVFDVEIEKVFDYVKDIGYDNTPFISADRTEKYFSRAEGQYCFLETVSLAFSLCILSKYALFKGLLDIDSKVVDRLRELLLETARIICDSIVPGGGWGFTKGCLTPDLYYTYIISESLADFGDYVRGETEGMDKDPDMEGWFPVDLLEELNKARLSAGDLLKSVYIDSENLVDGVTPTLLGEKPILPDNYDNRENIIQSCSFPPFHDGATLQNFESLYYSYYVIISLIVCGTDVNNAYSEEEKRKIKLSIENAIYLSRIQFEYAYGMKSWWDEKDESTLKIKLKDHDVIKLKENVEDPNLLPLALRCNLLYCYYISKGEDQKVNSLLELFISDRNEKTGLWDEYAYSIILTEKAIESFVDYYDYFCKFVFNAQPISSELTATPLKNDTLDTFLDKRIDESVRRILQEMSLESSPASTIPLPENLITKENMANFLNDLIREIVKKTNQEDSELIDENLFDKLSINLRSCFVGLLASGLIEEDTPLEKKKDIEKDLRDLLATIGVFVENDTEGSLSTLYSKLEHMVYK